MTCAACLTIPPVITTDYVLKGEFKTIAGLKTYITGSAASTSALLGVYDIFGFAPQTLQGADILATTLGARVVVPDFLNGRCAQGSWYAPTASEVEKKEKGDFMGFVFRMENFVPKVKEVIEGVERVQKWGGYGLCWGGKVIALTSGADTLFKVSAQCHPAGLASSDAENINIPHVVLASNGEEPEAVAEFKNVIEKKKGKVETFGDMVHGWMGARADFQNEEALKGYEKGYTAFAEFFKEHLV